MIKRFLAISIVLAVCLSATGSILPRIARDASESEHSQSVESAPDELILLAVFEIPPFRPFHLYAFKNAYTGESREGFVCQNNEKTR